MPLPFAFPHDATPDRIAVAAVFARTRTVVTQTVARGLEISGIADEAAPTLDAAFDVPIDAVSGPAVAPLASPGPRPVVAFVRGYAIDGRTLFSVPIFDPGSFHTLVALDAASLDALARIDLVGFRAVVSRTAGSLQRADLEVVSVDPNHVLVKWNARAVPVLRVREEPHGPVIAVGAGDATFSQISLASSASELAVEMSDGLHSITRVVHIFGR